MVICNIAEPITLLLVLLGVVLTVFLGKETKKSLIVAIMLFLFLALLIFHGVQLGLANKTDADLVYSATYNMGLDFAFVFISFIAYLWIDHIDAEANKKKSLDNSLDWFWNKV